MARRALTGVLLVGGRSTRFGSPKAHATFRGETLAARAWRLLEEACDERLAVGRDDALPFETLDDAREDAGPLGGIVAALRAAAHDVCVVVPVDMPLLDAAALRLLGDACREAAVAQDGPLPGAYARSALPVLEEALARGELRLRDVLGRLDVSTVRLEPAMLHNVNRPGDLESGVFRVAGDAYDDFMGRYSRRLAPLFAEFAGVREGMRVLDVGAGTGALIEELVRRGARATAVEPSPEFCAELRERFDDVHEAPAERLPFADGEFDAALAQLVVAFMADAPAAVAEMARVARTVAVTMWGVQEVEMFAAIERAARAIGVDRDAEQGARRYRTRAELVELLAPLGDVETGELDVTADYAGYDDFWNALTRQVGPAGAWVAKLDDEQRRQARETLQRELGSPSGPFQLRGRAFAAKVTRG